MRIYRTAAEALAMCDYKRAKRTDPTPLQRQAAREHWRAEPLLTRIAHLFKREAKQ